MPSSAIWPRAADAGRGIAGARRPGGLPDPVWEDIVGAHRFPPAIALQNAIPKSRNAQLKINKQ